MGEYIIEILLERCMTAFFGNEDELEVSNFCFNQEIRKRKGYWNEKLVKLGKKSKEIEKNNLLMEFSYLFIVRIGEAMFAKVETSMLKEICEKSAVLSLMAKNNSLKLIYEALLQNKKVSSQETFRTHFYSIRGERFEKLESVYKFNFMDKNAPKERVLGLN